MFIEQTGHEISLALRWCFCVNTVFSDEELEVQVDKEGPDTKLI